MLELDSTKVTTVKASITSAISSNQESVDINVNDVATYMSGDIDPSTMIKSEGDLDVYKKECIRILRDFCTDLKQTYPNDYQNLLINMEDKQTAISAGAAGIRSMYWPVSINLFTT